MEIQKKAIPLLLLFTAVLPALNALNLADWPVPAFLSDTSTYVPIFVDPQASTNGSGTNWDDPLQLSQLGQALPMPGTQNSHSPNGVILVFKEWRNTNTNRHQPITSSNFIKYYSSALTTTFSSLPVAGVRWGFRSTNTGQSNSRLPHSASSLLSSGSTASVAPSSVVVADLVLDGSYQTVVPDSGTGAVIAASSIPTTASVRFLDGVNILGGRMLAANGSGAGLGIDTTSNSIFISDSQFTDNFATDLGGAMYIPDGAVVVLANVNFYLNQAERTGGGAVYNESDALSVYQCIFDSNISAQGQGGAFYGFAGSDVDFVSNVFFNNNADQQGGAAYLSNNSTSAFVNNHFVNNSSELNGGAIFFAETAALDGTSVFRGLATSQDLGLTSDYDFYNNLFMFNVGAGLSTLGGQIRVTVGNPITLLHTDAFTSQKNFAYAIGEIVPVIDALANPRGLDNIMGTVDDNVLPTTDGSLINNGINAAVPTIGYHMGAKNLAAAYMDFFPAGWIDPTGDFLDATANPRIYVSTVDIGAYERSNYDVAPPILVALPVFTEPQAGDTVTLEAITHNATFALSYQWYYNGSPIPEGAGGTNPSLSFQATFFPVIEGTYRCVVTNSAGTDEVQTYVVVFQDSDGDGLSTYREENIHLTDPSDPDSDNDGLLDGDEVLTYLTNPKDSDSDSDGLLDNEEVLTFLTDPNDPDPDSDGLTDYQEVLIYSTDPHLADTDGDELSDGDEVLTYQTNPNLVDSDGDLFNDKFEIIMGYDPNDSANTPQGLAEVRTAVEFSFYAAIGQSYTIEVSVDLQVWDVIETGIEGNGARVDRLYSMRETPKLFFRATEEVGP